MEKMTEMERNGRLIKLLEKLRDDEESLELISSMVDNDTPAMQKTYELMTTSNFFTDNFDIGMNKKDDGAD